MYALYAKGRRTLKKFMPARALFACRADQTKGMIFVAQCKYFFSSFTFFHLLLLLYVF